MHEDTQHTQQRSAFLAARHADVTVAKLWLHYYSVGGELEEFELDAYLHGIHPLPLGERNMIALALNELIDELPCRPRADVVPEPLHG